MAAASKKMPLDFSKFKMVKSDDKTTILAHPDGHHIMLVHNALSPENRAELKKLKQQSDHMYDNGGEVKKGPQPTYLPDQSAITDIPTVMDAKGASSGTYAPVGPQSKADGGVIDPSPTPSPSPDDQSIGKKIKYPGFANGGMPQSPAEYDAQQAALYGTSNGTLGVDTAPKPSPSPTATPTADPIPSLKSSPSLSRMQINYADGGRVKMADGGSPASDGSVDTSDAATQNGKNITINVGQPAPAAADSSQQPTNGQDVAHHIGEAIRQYLPQLMQYSAPGMIMNAEKAALPYAKSLGQGLTGNDSGSMTSPDSTPPSSTVDMSGSPAVSTAAPQQQPQAPQDPYGQEAYAKEAQQGLANQETGITNEAAAQGQQGHLVAQAAQQQAADQQKTLDDYKQHTNDLNNEYSSFVQDVQNNHIDPNHYLNSQGTLSKIGTGIGLLLSGLGSGLSRQPNMAMNFLQDQINRDIYAQKANLGASQSLLSANLHQYGNMRDAADMTKAMQLGVLQSKIQQAAAQTTDPLAKARALQAVGQIQTQQIAPILQQTALRRTLMQGANQGNVDPAVLPRMGIVDPKDREAYETQLQKAQNADALRRNTLSAFDQLSKLNTVGNRVLNPIQATRQAAAIQGPVLDALTKDTSGRVTPETVKLIGSTFSKIGNSAETNAVERQRLDDLLSQGMNYPMLKQYGVSKYERGAPAPQVTFKKR